MNLTMNKLEIYGRALLYCGIASLMVISPALAADTPQKWSAVYASAALQAMLALRAFVDKSPAQGEPDADTVPMPVEVTNKPDNAVPVDETGGEPTEG